MADTILVVGAHSDDFVLGAGGTIAKYVAEGKKVISVIYSKGELTHPWLDKEHAGKMRMSESDEAIKILGVSDNTFFSARDGKFNEDIKKEKIVQKVRALIKKHKVKKIFTHYRTDPHPDHRAVYHSMLTATQGLDVDLYCFDIWSHGIRSLESNQPKLVVDITHTFSLKRKALWQFRSQLLYITSLIISMYIDAVKTGIRHKCWLAEVFVKEK